MYSNMPQNAGNHVLESFSFQTYLVNYPLKTPRGASYFVMWHACYESIVQFSHQLSSNYTPSAISNDNPASISCNHLCNLAPTFPMKNCVNSYLLNDGKNETMGDITFVITVSSTQQLQNLFPKSWKQENCVILAHLNFSKHKIILYTY